MTGQLVRVQVLLGKEQHDQVMEIAKSEGKSVSGLVREVLQERIEARGQQEVWDRRALALERLTKLSEEIAERHGVYLGENPVIEARREREAQLDEVMYGQRQPCPTDLVVDASAVIELVTRGQHYDEMKRLTQGWQTQQIGMYAPTLWAYEVTSSLRKQICSGRYSADEAAVALDELLGLGVELVHPSRQLLHRTLWWASRISQRVAYDAAYLAVAEELSAAFWTADRRLCMAARNAGARWMHLLGEAE